ncbi:hypothetical protein NGRA_2097 [Nosema granulosis]|uniref:PH domain-containing protein n=1 Tax=Nosema granulosis TaxID=83296 RepID=A0A9P6KYZ2_9MICR|nr:hypothetical protein NGRA_2097 [Nosema granulosis]
MNKKEQSSQDSSESNKSKNFRRFIVSDSYDEMKFIDDWITYAEMYKNEKDKSQSRYDDSHPFTDSCIPDVTTHFKVEEDSSFSSVMDLYLNDDTKYLTSSEQTDSQSAYHSESTLDIIELWNTKERPDEDSHEKESYTDSENESRNADEKVEDKSVVHLVRVFSKDSKPEKASQTELKVSLKTAFCSHNKSKIRINTVEHPTILNLETSKKACSKKIRLNSHRSIVEDAIITPKEEQEVENEEFEYIEPIETDNLLIEAEKRTIQQNKRSSNDVPLRRFFIETEESQILMRDAFQLNDLKKKVILGELTKRGNNGHYQKNWFQLRENFFTCFNGKKNLISPNDVPQERLGDIEHPDDPLSFLSKKYSIDLLSSRILLCKKKGKRDFFTCFSENIPAEEDLVDVTDIVITNIQEAVYGYRVFLQKDNQKAEITMSCLNFCLKTNDGYRFYKPDSIEDFLKWMIAFRFRLGQIELEIGL